MSAGVQWLMAAIVASILMICVYLRQRRTGNAGYVDVAWAFCIGVLAMGFVAVAPAPPMRRTLVALIAAFWSVRLTTYLYRRVSSDEAEDGRYAELRSKWGEDFQVRIFWFFQLQAAATLLFALAPWTALQATRDAFDAWDGLGAIVAIVGLGGVALADWQLSQFRRKPENRGHTCQVGLWKYSRHPNYFFEWVHWWCYLPIAIGADAWWAAAITPLVLLYFLVFKTGIPPTEAQALTSRGEEYRRYQRSTSVFVPWFPKRDSA